MSKRFEYPMCDSYFFSRSDLESHINSHRDYDGYQELIPLVLQRDRYTCQICGINFANNKFGFKYRPVSVVHHIDRNKKNNTIENLVTLCTSCHMSYHRRKTFEESKNKQIDEKSLFEKVKKAPII